VGFRPPAGQLRDVVLFGAFLIWAVADFAISRRRDRAARAIYEPGTPAGYIQALAVGAIVWAVLAFWLHRALIGVDPVGARRSSR
jgi:uncharacterized membrane protein